MTASCGRAKECGSAVAALMDFWRNRKVRIRDRGLFTTERYETGLERVFRILRGRFVSLLKA
jgi:hypothetical protein